MPEDAVLDAPASEELDLGSPEIDAGEPEVSTESVDTHDEPQEGETGNLRGKELYRAVKDKLKNGEKLSPQEIRSVRNAIHIAGRADEATGGDIARFEAEKQIFESLRSEGEEAYTPEQVVEKIKADRQQLAGILNDVAAGSPQLVDEIAQDNPEAFQALTLHAMDKFAQINNEAFSTYVAKSAFGYLASKQVPQQFTLLDRFLPQKSDDPGTQIVIDAVNAVREALRELGGMAARPLESKQPARQEQKPGSQEGDLRERENNVRRVEWDSEVAPTNRQLRDSEISKAAAARKMQLTEQERSQVLAAIKEEFDTRISVHRNVLKGYLEANNKSAYQDRIKSEGKKMLPSMVQRHVNAVLDARPKGGTQQNGKIGTKQSPAITGKSDATGAVWLAGSPGSLGLPIDYTKTTHAMMVGRDGVSSAYIKGRSGLHKWKARVA